MDINERMTGHYGHGTLEQTVMAGLDRLLASSDDAPIDLLASIDEFHMGGRPATREVVRKLGIDASHRVLDVGCGLGGTARHMASEHGCQVDGVDLTAEYVEVGNALNRRIGLSGQIDLAVSDAADLPHGDKAFDRVTMLHVGMNIENKATLFGEIARVMKPGGKFAVFDVMRLKDGAVSYPTAWASDDSTSFLARPDDYRDALEGAGFGVNGKTEMASMALQFFKMLKARLAQGGPPPLGLHILMGQNAPTKVANMAAAVSDGLVAPVLMIAQRFGDHRRENRSER